MFIVRTTRQKSWKWNAYIGNICSICIDFPRRSFESWTMRIISCLLLVGLIAFSSGTVERMLDMALQILPSVIKNPKKLEMFKVGTEILFFFSRISKLSAKKRDVSSPWRRSDIAADLDFLTLLCKRGLPLKFYVGLHATSHHLDLSSSIDKRHWSSLLAATDYRRVEISVWMASYWGRCVD